MDGVLEQPCKKTSVPSRRVRLAWWLFIYAGGLPACYVFHQLTDRFSAPLSPMVLLGTVMSLPFIPMGLGEVYTYAIQWIFSFFIGDNARQLEGPIMLITYPLGYITYVIHLSQTQRAKTYRVFLLLMLSLVLISSASLAGCIKATGTIHLQQ